MLLYSEPKYVFIEQPYEKASQQQEINAYLIPTNEENLFYLVDSNFFYTQPLSLSSPPPPTTTTTTIKIEISIQNPNLNEENFTIFNDNDDNDNYLINEQELNEIEDTELDSSIYNCCLDSFSTCYSYDINFIKDDFLVSLDNPKIPNHLKRKHQVMPLVKQFDNTNNFSFKEAKCLNYYLNTIPEDQEYHEIDDDFNYDDFSDWDSDNSELFAEYLS
jgi:hypothetical protein